MKFEQQIVVKWMEKELKRTGWTAQRWAKEAKVSPTSVTRAMHPSFRSVTTLPTLHKLARASGSRSVLDFLEES